MRGHLSDDQIRLLTAPLDPSRVKKAQGQSHLEGWDVRAHLTRIFGFDGWDEEILSCECIYEHLGNELKADKKQWYVTYRCTMRLTVWGDDPEGHRAVAKVSEEGAIGGAENQPSHADAHDLAMKESMTQALKRCAINLGNQFGLSLYSDGSTASVAEPIQAVPDGTLRKDDAKKRVAVRVKTAWPKAHEDFIKGTARSIWDESGVEAKLTTINGAPYLPATEVGVLDSVCDETIRTMLEDARTA